jgi:plastocyanin
MSAPLKNLRIIPRDSEFLNRKTGALGEIFYDSGSNTLRLYSGQSQGGVSLAKNDLTNVSNATFLAKANLAGISSGSSGSLTVATDDSTIVTVAAGNTLQFIGENGITTSFGPNDEIVITQSNEYFSKINVAGQGQIQADELADILTLVAGSNITITTDPATDTITISSSGGGGGGASNSFETIAVAGQSSVVADSATDTLTLVAGTGISITTNAGTDTVTITSTVSTGATAFTGLSDVSAASLTVDKIYLPAITMLIVTNNGTSAYRFDQYGTTDDPTIYAINGTTIAFNLQASGHPFLIQDGAGANYNTGLVHVSTAGAVSTGSSAQSKDSGTLYWKIPDSISGSYRYQCGSHAGMVGSIIVKNFGSI